MTIRDDLDREDRLALFIGAVEGISDLVSAQPRGTGIDSDAISDLLAVVTRFAEPLREARTGLRAND